MTNLLKNPFLNRVRGIVTSNSFYTYLGIVFLSYIALIISRVSGSSMGMLSDSGQGLLAGANRPIRSDEYLRGTPTEVGAINFPDSPGVSLLSSPGFDEPGIEEFELLRPERFLIHLFLGGELAFAATWWVPALFVLVGVPLLLKQFKLPLSISVGLSLIVILSPSVVWWSNGMAGIIGRLSLGVALIIMASRSSGFRIWVLGILGSWIASGVAMDYQPWSIIASLFFLPLVLFTVLRQRAKILPLIAGGVIGLAPLVYFLFSKIEVFQVMSATLYPGQRRVSSGLINALNWSLAAPQQWSLVNPDGINYSNQSEISMGFFLFLFPALYFAYSSRSTKRAFGIREVVLGGYLLIVSWAFIQFPELPFNPLALVSPERTLTMVTTLAPLVFGLLYANWRNEHQKDLSNIDSGQRPVVDIWANIALAVLVAALTFSSAMTMEGVVLNFSTRLAVVVAILCGLFVYLIIHPRFTTWGVWSFALIAVFVGGAVNPIAQGTAPLTDNSLSRTLNGIEGEGSWASDGIHLDAMLIANGKPSISGQQLTGPDRTKWTVIDPQLTNEGIWNAGASFVVLSWDASLQSPEITRPFGDTILVRINPCSDSLGELDLRFILSRSELFAPCLPTGPVETVDWMGAPVYVYELKR